MGIFSTTKTRQRWQRFIFSASLVALALLLPSTIRAQAVRAVNLTAHESRQMDGAAPCFEH